jgi:hypothetical protein
MQIHKASALGKGAFFIFRNARKGKLLRKVVLQLSDRVPKENFYRRPGETLDLQFLYRDTHELYGKAGNPSIDPAVIGCVDCS